MLRIPWLPRLILQGRQFRLPIQAAREGLALEAPGFAVLGQRWSERDAAFYYYLRAPEASGDYTLRVFQQGQTAEALIQVRSLDQLRQPFSFNSATWPRRWPVGQSWETAKTQQTLQDFPICAADPQTLAWWATQDDATLWRQLPPAELPRAHFVNVHQGCPRCGTAVFQYSGFYPWKRQHLPCDFRSTCPSCGAVFPSNDLMAGDFTGGEYADDGFGYFDPEGHLFLFAATYHRDQTRACWAGIDQLTRHLRHGGLEARLARKLGLLLLRQAVEEVYLGAVPQFRYGPSQGVEVPWEWGQPDWAAAPDPVAALARKGTVHYSIDIPYVSEVLALAYDTLWPFLRQDQELVERAQSLGAPIDSPEEVVDLVEEMLACLLQCALDGGAASNLPRVSQGSLVLLRGLDRPDAQEVMDWLYDRGPDKLRVFGTNGFFPDGTPPEATRGYNDIHTNGLFALEHHLRRLRQAHPAAYPQSRFPSLLADPRAPRVLRAPYEIAMLGKVPFQFGDGGSAVQEPLSADAYHTPLPAETLEWAVEFTGDPVVREVREAVTHQQHRRLGSTIHDGAGIAILRTGETPERAAVGIAYGDATGHRHMDLLDVQFFAFDQPFLTDLGYPQSWASIENWEAHWATHNTVWGVVPGLSAGRLAGRGRLVRTLSAEGVQVLELEAERWAWDAGEKRWYRPGVKFRRLLALVETDREGVALVDLARIRGGAEHWRCCRGLEGDFIHELGEEQRPGTAAHPNGRRGQLDPLTHPDHAALAYMDQVAALAPRPSWKGSWQSRRQAGLYLDLHQLRSSPGTQVMTARATAIMGKPEESRYLFRALLWKNAPERDQTTCVDLVFEPRLGAPALESAQAIAADQESASGVELVTATGRTVKIYWNPEPGNLTRFADGALLQGSLAVVREGVVTAVGAASFESAGKKYHFPHAHQQGRITAIDRQKCTIEVEGLQGISRGDRVRINPQGRGHNYQVEEVEELGPQRHCLRLDFTTSIGRARVALVQGSRVELDFNIMTRTGNLHGLRLQRDADGTWEEIAAAMNPDPDHTVVELKRPLVGLRPGDWVSAVDGAAGDEVVFEPVSRESG